MVIDVGGSWSPVGIVSAPDIGFHTSLEEGVLLFETVNVESYFAFVEAFDAEVEPLSVAARVGVDPHVQVVLKISHPH